MLIYYNKLHRTSVQPITGIYFLFSNNELVYVGQSTDVLRRIQQHRSDKVFDEFCFKKCLERDLDTLERNTIRFYKPRYNIVQNKEREIELPEELNTEEFKLEFSRMQESTARIRGNMFYAKIKSEVVFSKVVRTNKRGLFKFKFSNFVGEFTGSGVARIQNHSGWFRKGQIYFYFKPSVQGFGWDIEYESLRK